MRHILYKVTNLKNSKIYIGVHSTSNILDNYMGSGIGIKRAINKHGKENFKREILQEFDTREEALFEEAKIVDGDFIRRKDTYNANVGGGHNWYGMVTVKDKDGKSFQVAKDDPRLISGELVGNRKGTTITKQHKQAIIDSNTGRQLSSDHKEKLSKKLKGRIMTEEHKEKLSLAHLGKPLTQLHKDKISKANIGHQCSDKTKKKISIANTGRMTGYTHSSESKHKISEANRNSKWMHNVSLRKNARVQLKDVLQYESNGWKFGRKSF